MLPDYASIIRSAPGSAASYKVAADCVEDADPDLAALLRGCEVLAKGPGDETSLTDDLFGPGLTRQYLAVVVESGDFFGERGGPLEREFVRRRSGKWVYPDGPAFRGRVIEAGGRKPRHPKEVPGGLADDLAVNVVVPERPAKAYCVLAAASPGGSRAWLAVPEGRSRDEAFALSFWLTPVLAGGPVSLPADPALLRYEDGELLAECRRRGLV